MKLKYFLMLGFLAIVLISCEKGDNCRGHKDSKHNKPQTTHNQPVQSVEKTTVPVSEVPR